MPAGKKEITGCLASPKCMYTFGVRKRPADRWAVCCTGELSKSKRAGSLKERERENGETFTFKAQHGCLGGPGRP